MNQNANHNASTANFSKRTNEKRVERLIAILPSGFTVLAVQFFDLNYSEKFDWLASVGGAMIIWFAILGVIAGIRSKRKQFLAPVSSRGWALIMILSLAAFLIVVQKSALQGAFGWLGDHLPGALLFLIAITITVVQALLVYYSIRVAICLRGRTEQP